MIMIYATCPMCYTVPNKERPPSVMLQRFQKFRDCRALGTALHSLPKHLAKKGSSLMDIIPSCPNESNTPHYTLNQPLWLDDTVKAQFIKYNARTVKIRLWGWFIDQETHRAEREQSFYEKNVDISRISPRTSNGKEVNK